MPSCGCFAPAVNGETYLRSINTSKRYSIMAPANLFNQLETDGTLERSNRALNQLDRKQEEQEALPSAFSVDNQSIKP